MITPAAFLFWFAELALEITGALLTFRHRRKLSILWLYLGFRALADMVTMGLYCAYVTSWQVNWIQKGVQYLFLCALAAQICARLTGERRRGVVAFLAFVISLAASWIGIALFVTGQDLQVKILGSMCASAMLLGIVILIIRLDAGRTLDAPWTIIMRGLIVALVTNAVLFFCWNNHLDGARHLIPIGEIAALLMWNYAGKGTLKLRGARAPLCVRGEALDLAKAAS
jgi:FtsH-binding integral membrane protein